MVLPQTRLQYTEGSSVQRGEGNLEYLDGSKTKKKNCKVTDWHMDELTGASEIIFLVPKTKGLISELPPHIR